MSKTYFIFKRDFKSYFISPLAYIIIGVFFFINSLISVPELSSADMKGFFGAMSFLFVFMLPFITMRSFSEEFRSGTDEFLLTSPVTPVQIVIGKYLAVLAIALVVFVISLQYVVVIALFGKPDWGPVLSGYLGMTLLVGALSAFGVFASSLTKSQLASAAITFGFFIMLLIIQQLSSAFGHSASQFFSAIGAFDHFFDFVKGVIDSVHVIYYAGFIFLFLFLTVMNLDAKRG